MVDDDLVNFNFQSFNSNDLRDSMENKVVFMENDIINLKKELKEKES